MGSSITCCQGQRAGSKPFDPLAGEQQPCLPWVAS